MNDFFQTATPKLTQDCLGLIVLGPATLKKTDSDFFHLNFLLDGLLSQKGAELSHKDTFLTKQFGQTIFLLYFDQEKIGELETGLSNTLSMLKGEHQKRKKIVLTGLDQKEIPNSEKLRKSFQKLGLELVI